jgi:outer membrane receptor protein involved in Fe transport
MTYLSVSKGVKPGGISTVASGTWMDQEPEGDLDELEFGSEKLTAYEVGAKTRLFDRTLVLNGALSHWSTPASVCRASAGMHCST